MTAKLTLSLRQIEAIAARAEEHPEAEFELYEDEVSGRRVLILDATWWPPDATNQRDGAEGAKYLVTQSYDGSAWVVSTVKL